MQTIKDVNPDRLPKHVAIIMDGNGRWAKQRGRLRIFGHENGVEAVRQTVENCARPSIDFLTLVLSSLSVGVAIFRFCCLEETFDHQASSYTPLD